MTIRGKLSQLFNPGFGHCKCCGTTWNNTETKSLNYTNTRGFFPVCRECYHDPDVLYSDLMDYYGNPYDDRFSPEEKDYILNSLFEETKTNDIIKEKYQNHLILIRSNKIETILN